MAWKAHFLVFGPLGPWAMRAYNIPERPLGVHGDPERSFLAALFCTVGCAARRSALLHEPACSMRCVAASAAETLTWVFELLTTIQVHIQPGFVPC